MGANGQLCQMHRAWLQHNTKCLGCSCRVHFKITNQSTPTCKNNTFPSAFVVSLVLISQTEILNNIISVKHPHCLSSNDAKKEEERKQTWSQFFLLFSVCFQCPFFFLHLFIVMFPVLLSDFLDYSSMIISCGIGFRLLFLVFTSCVVLSFYFYLFGPTTCFFLALHFLIPSLCPALIGLTCISLTSPSFCVLFFVFTDLDFAFVYWFSDWYTWFWFFWWLFLFQ